MGQGPSDGMSDAQSPFDSIPPDSRFGWKVMTVFPNSPSSGLGIVPYFSILTHVNGQRCGRSEHDLLPLIRENVPTEFTFLNLSNLQSKSVTITPRRNWGGEGLLGLMIRFEHSFENSHLEAVHVLEVHHGSPAEKAGLRAHVDFMLGDSKIAFKNYDALDLFLTQHDGHEGRLLVFNRDTFSVRDVFIRPSQAWGGAGSLGCDVGLGMLHQLPIDGKREVVYYEQQTGTENNAIASSSSTGATQPMMPQVAPSADQFQQHRQQQQQFPQQPPQQQFQPQQQVQQQQQPQQFQQPLPPQQFQPNQFQPQFQQQQQQQQQSMTQTFQQVSPQQQQQSLSPPQQQFQQPQQQVESFQQAAPAPAPVPAPVPSPVMSPPQFVAPPAEAVASSFPQPVSNMNIPPMASPPQSFAPSSNPPSMVNPSVVDSAPSGVPSSAPSQAPVSVGGLSTANFAPSSTDARLSSDPAALQALLAYQQQQFEQQRLQFQAQQAAWEAQQRQQQQHIANPNNNLPFPSTITQQPTAGLP